MTLDELRERLTALDRELLALVAERQRLSGDVAAVKQRPACRRGISSASATYC